MNKLLIPLLLVVMHLFIVPVSARDLGKIGPTYDIAETHLLELIKERMQEKIDSGFVQNEQSTMRNRAMEQAKRPKGITLPSALEYKNLSISPSLTLREDIKDQYGKVLYPAGTTVNPLSVRPMTKTLCFFDGDVEEQVLWVGSNCMDNPRNKLILVNGNIPETAESLDTFVYFDQGHRLTERFQISALPAVVRQSGNLLYVEQFPIR